LSIQQPSILQTWKERAGRLKKEVYALYLAYRDSRTPWYGKAFAALVIAYAFSPIDLIPDPIPVLGYLDDLILLPLGIALVLRLIPAPVMAECRVKAQERLDSGHPVNWIAAAVIVCVWIALAVIALRVVVG
jgi:uncharacterized membrane protein YkvA (DUF1232 family)